MTYFPGNSSNSASPRNYNAQSLGFGHAGPCGAKLFHPRYDGIMFVPLKVISGQMVSGEGRKEGRGRWRRVATVVGIKPPINGQSFIPFKNSVLTLGPSSGIARAPRQALGPPQHV